MGTGAAPSDELELHGLVLLTWAITDRLQWTLPLPAFSYRLGEPGRAELTARAGLIGIGYRSVDGVIGTLDAGAAARVWLARPLSLIAYGAAQWDFQTGSRFEGRPSRTDFVELRASLGLSWHLGERLTVSLGGGWSGEARVRDSVPERSPRRAITFGAVQALGYRPLPLVQLHLSKRFSLDGYASWSIDLGDDPDRQRYLLGLSWVF